MRQSSDACSSGAPDHQQSKRRRRVRAAGLGLGALAITLTASGCTANEIVFLDLPDPVTKEGLITQNLWHGAWIAAWAVGLVTWGLMIWAAIVYRRRHKDDVPEQTKYNIPLEILYTVVPLIMILGLFFFTARDQAEILAVKNDQDITVQVTAYRWNWAFSYLDQDAFSVGSPNKPAELVLPVGEKVRFELVSPDVIHSFWVPDFLFKMDVIPGKTNVFELTPDKVGVYPGRCAELCGVDHARMLFTVRVVEKAEFDQFIADQKAHGQSGVFDTGMTTDHGQMPDARTT
ncbi:MAG: cytochrome c oxidase subunit II [Actinomycetales bacterium]|nr:cytochrome c oxidase subunit II [Actinomycetales bacterium]